MPFNSTAAHVLIFAVLLDGAAAVGAPLGAGVHAEGLDPTPRASRSPSSIPAPPPRQSPAAEAEDRRLASLIAASEALASGIRADDASSSATPDQPSPDTERALEDAIEAARALLAHRELHLGATSTAGAAWLDSGLGEWWEITEARWSLRHLVALRDRSVEERRRLLEARRLDTSGRGALQRGDLAVAEARFTEALDIRLALLEPGHPERCVALGALAAVRMRQAEFAAAEALLREALEGLELTYAGFDQRSAGLRFNRAVVRESLGQYEAAEEQARVAIDAWRRVAVGDDLTLVGMLNGLGGILLRRGLMAEAESVLDESIAMIRRIFVRPPASLAHALNTRGLILQQRGKLTEARASCSDALAIIEEIHGRGRGESESGSVDHPDAVTSLVNLASITGAMGDLTEAETFSRRAVAMARRVLGPRHPGLANALAQLGAVLFARGDTAASIECHEAAISIFRLNYPDGHPSLADALHVHASILSSDDTTRRSVLAQAESLAREAARTARTAYGDDDPRTMRVLLSLAEIIAEREDGFAEAETIFVEAIECLRRSDPDGSFPLARALAARAALHGLHDRIDEAEPLLRESLEIRRRLDGEGGQIVLHAVTALADLSRRLGRDEDALHGYLEALDLAERRRAQIIGGPLERDRHAERLDLRRIAAHAAILLLRAGRPDEAMALLDRGRGRAALDLALGSLDGPGAIESRLRSLADEEQVGRFIKARDAERTALVALREAEARVAALALERNTLAREGRPLEAQDAELDLWRQRATERRIAAEERWGELLLHLRGLEPAGVPMRADELLATLGPDEAIVTWAFTESRACVIMGRGGPDGGGVRGAVIADSVAEIEALEASVASLRALLEQRPIGGAGFDGEILDALATQLLPDAIVDALLEADSGTGSAAAPDLVREAVPGADLAPAGNSSPRPAARRLIVVPDGPLHLIPLDLLVDARRSVPVVVAPSATLAVARRLDRGPAAPPASRVLLLGDCDFGTTEAFELPSSGVLVHQVTPGSTAERAGILAGDILRRYDDMELKVRADLTEAIAARAQTSDQTADDPQASIDVELLRDGALVRTSVNPGRLGVHIDDRPLAEGLRTALAIERAVGDDAAQASTLTQLRLHGDALAPLAWTRREIESIAAIHGAHAATLLREQATTAALRDAALGAPPPRVIHLATHGILGTADRPLEASLALTRPAAPTVDDIGFLTLAELIRDWSGGLHGTELVVLSACNTASAKTSGESPIGLPLGFLTAGARTVVGSLWKVDDAATALLMCRFHANRAGRQTSPRTVDGATFAPGVEMPTLAALREAQTWLQTLPRAERDELLGIDSAAMVSDRVRGEILPRRTPPPPTPPGEADGGAACPYDHPYYWAGFIVVGEAE